MIVYVLDASAIINMKKAIPVTTQWDFFKDLEARVDSEAIAIPGAVIREVANGPHPDMPGAWARGMQPRLLHPLEPPPEIVADVMARAGDVVDLTSDREQADPYVVALAIHVAATGRETCVVTDDVVDRVPIKIALSTACARLGLDCCTLPQFLEEL